MAIYPIGRPDDIDRFDAIVVGGRVAGASTAMLLARRGLRVVVVDRAAEGSDTLSTHALMRPGVVQLHRWGLLDEVVATGAPPVRRTVIHYGDEAVAVNIKPRSGIDAFYAPRRTVLDAVVVRAARQAGVQFLFGTTVTELRRHATGRVVGVHGRDPSGNSLRLDAPITIGADGVRSLVARGVQATAYWQGVGSSAVVYAYFAGLDAEGYEWAYRPGASSALIPTNGGEVNVSIIVPSVRFTEEVRPDVEAGFWNVLREANGTIAERVAQAQRTTRFRSFPGLAAYHRQAWGPGWALVGDAGAFLDPIGAHGISSALRDAELLARGVAEIHHGTAPEWQALGSYQRARDDLAQHLFEATDAVATYGWDLDTLRDRLMQMSAEMTKEAEALEHLDHQPLAATDAA
jgi:2-polyprenyl-6-methoxyphenol hydroxylase-like FAD-dependent oxidoreductase